MHRGTWPGLASTIHEICHATDVNLGRTTWHSVQTPSASKPHPGWQQLSAMAVEEDNKKVGRRLQMLEFL